MKKSIKRMMPMWIKSFIYGINNLRVWLPVVWKDRDWDHAYFETVMLVKLEKWYKKYSDIDNLILPYEGIEKHLQAMRICINILKRRSDDWYTHVWYSNRLQQKVKYEFVPIVFEGEQMFEWNSSGLTEEEELENSRLLKNSRSAEERDWRIFCRILEKYQSCWWD